MPLLDEDASYVIVALNNIDYLHEITWPGKVEIGTGFTKIGNSSIKIYQQLFQNNICVTTAETVIVQVDDKTGKSKLLTEDVKQKLSRWMLKDDR